jgi:hypothetical protein
MHSLFLCLLSMSRVWACFPQIQNAGAKSNECHDKVSRNTLQYMFIHWQFKRSNSYKTGTGLAILCQVNIPLELEFIHFLFFVSGIEKI